MRQLVFNGPHEVLWQEAPAPRLNSPAAALVRPIVVATCDLDTAMIRGTYPWTGAPHPLGHEGVADVVAIGDGVANVAPGDRVIVPFQISCGSCTSCRRGRTGNCSAHPPLSSYGLGSMGGLEWGGLLADLAIVPHADAMLVPLPTGIDPHAAASISDNLADAWRCVGPQLSVEPAVDVLVVASDSGPSSIGLYAAGLAVTLDAHRVVYLDDDHDRLDIAATLGAEPIEGPPPRKAGAFPITVDASGTEAGLRCALNSTAFDGWCTSPSVYLADPRLPMFAMYSRCCTLHTGRAHVRAVIPDVLEALQLGFDPSPVASGTVGWEDADAALADPPRKLILSRSEATGG